MSAHPSPVQAAARRSVYERLLAALPHECMWRNGECVTRKMLLARIEGWRIEKDKPGLSPRIQKIADDRYARAMEDHAAHSCEPAPVVVERIEGGSPACPAVSRGGAASSESAVVGIGATASPGESANNPAPRFRPRTPHEQPSLASIMAAVAELVALGRRTHGAPDITHEYEQAYAALEGRIERALHTRRDLSHYLNGEEPRG